MNDSKKAFHFENDSIKQFASIQQFFCFDKTEWAAIFSVPRAVIVGWIVGECVPSVLNASKINHLYDLISAIPNRKEGDRLFRGYIHHQISAYDCSLYEVLKSTIPGDDTALALIPVLSSLVEKSRKKAKELDDLKKSGDSSQTTFDYNLKRLFSYRDS